MSNFSPTPLYGISGLGAEQHIFDRVNAHLTHPIQMVDWVPHEPTDDLERYALRLLETMDTSRPFHLLGLSFGGMLATEMLKHVRPLKTVLVSSAACRHELRALYRRAGSLGLVGLLPDVLMTPSAKLVNHALRWSNPRFKALPHRIIDKEFAIWMKWASKAITEWTNDEAPGEVIRIHGTKDLILPKCVEVDYAIEGGSHFIITEHAERVAEILEMELYGTPLDETAMEMADQRPA